MSKIWIKSFRSAEWRTFGKYFEYFCMDDGSKFYIHVYMVPVFIAVEHLGERSLAITNIIRNVSALPFMIVITFSSTCSTLISNLIGAGNTRYVRGTLNQCIRMAYLFVLPIILFFILCPNWILRIYTDMPDLISASLPSLFVLCSAYIFIVPGNVYFQSVSGTGNTVLRLFWN